VAEGAEPRRGHLLSAAGAGRGRVGCVEARSTLLLAVWRRRCIGKQIKTRPSSNNDRATAAALPERVLPMPTDRRRVATGPLTKQGDNPRVFSLNE